MSNEYHVEGGFDWLAYRAQVALRVIDYYVRVFDGKRGNLVADSQSQAVEAAVELAEKVERRLKRE